MSRQRDDFFIGYLGRLPQAGRGVIGLMALGLLLGFVGGALAISMTQDHAGPARYGAGIQEPIIGVVFADPYPHLRTPPSAEHPNGRSFLLVRQGKRGWRNRAIELNGQPVAMRGRWVRRGDLRMIQNGPRGWGEPAANVRLRPLAPVEKLGRWRVTGEICDGKCWFGAMRPGEGVAHKACANLCLMGGAPPVLVATETVEGSEFMLLADRDGKPLPPMTTALTAVLLTLEGALERHGDMLIFKVDLDQAEIL